jgi:ATPase family associated with various cellular activities (AAA)
MTAFTGEIMETKRGYPIETVHWHVDGDRGSATHAAFKSNVYINGLSIMIQRNLAATDHRLTPASVDGELIMWTELPKWRFVVVRRRDTGAVVHVVQGNGQTVVEVAASALDIAERVVGEIQAAFPPIPVGSEPLLPFLFWHNEGGSADANARKIAVVRWDSISANYAREPQAPLATLMEGFAPDAHYGRLMLWHGRPGTGKTYAVRALAWAWRDWCRFECVLDPEGLLSNAHYLMEVLMHEEDEGEDERKWRMLVLEDAGEMMGIDARRRFGQGLSRLLNLTDGILGQGRKLMVLVTTNEELGKLNPATTRPGRCLSPIEFRPLSVAEANGWLASAKCMQRVDSPRALSELYAALTGRVAANAAGTIGFRADHRAHAGRTR